jgi:beta-galactosidase
MLDTFLLKEHHAKLPNKPVIIAEYGAGSDPRIRSDEPRRFDFSIDYMNYYHEYYLSVINKYDFVAGGAIWNLVEFNSEGRKDAVPHVNQKGIVTYDRQPKDLFWYYKAQWNNEPMVKIAPVLNDKRCGMQDDKEHYTSTQKIWIYTNLDKVELIANGKSLGRFDAKDKKVVFEVPFINGKNKLEARAASEGKIYQDFQEVDFTLYPLNLKDEKAELNEINIICGSHYYFTDDYGQIWMKDKPYEKGNFGYIGGKQYERWPGGPAGDKEIFGTTDEPIYQTQHVNPEAYQFDVPNGKYEVTLRFAEILTEKDAKKLLYNLGADNVKDEAIERVFNVLINETTVVEKLNLRKQIGEMQAYDVKFRIKVKDDNGIKISFDPVKGDPVINAIKVRKMY